MQKKIRITDLLYPHWPTLTLAFVAVIGESLTDLLEPWPLKIVFDYIFGSKRMPDWLASAVSFIGTDKLSILDFAVLAVIVIAIFGALSSYLEKYLTTSVGQWVMHDLRRVLYSHIQKLSLSYHDQKRTGDLISTVTSDIDAVQSLISQVLLGLLVNLLTLVGMVLVMLYLNWEFTLIALLVAPGLFLVVYHYTHRIKKASRAVRRQEGEVHSVLENEMQVRDLTGAKPAPRFKGKIEFDRVNFSYNEAQPVLKDRSLKIEPGQLAALVGPTGAGKTTIVSLLPRFYDLTSGEIKIDGTDIRKFKQKSLREQISFVLQETLLFRAPVWQNIAYGKPEASRAEIIRAAKLANADEFIDKMPEGYDTMIGEHGATLSGGQRQRITIARAIIRNSPILILDEPSAGLDAESEKLVFDALGNLMEGKTSIVIAHRLATVIRADVIFVIDDGKVVEQGTHAELLAGGGLYSRLYELQFRGEEADSLELVSA